MGISCGVICTFGLMFEALLFTPRATKVVGFACVTMSLILLPLAMSASDASGCALLAWAVLLPSACLRMSSRLCLLLLHIYVALYLVVVFLTSSSSPAFHVGAAVGKATPTIFVYALGGLLCLERKLSEQSDWATFAATWQISVLSLPLLKESRRNMYKLREKRQDQLETQLRRCLWQEDEGAKARVIEKLQTRGENTAADVADIVAHFEKLNSQQAGPSVAYILSDGFLHEARVKSGKDDPTFRDMQETFFDKHSGLGHNHKCPRDGDMGCALVDFLRAPDRGECTHFLSWTWSYTIGEVRDALSSWIELSSLDPKLTYLWMCFFCNNQYRILGSVSDNLEEAFEDNLLRIGTMVALLNSWDRPVYLTRIWTIYEQFKCVQLEVPVVLALTTSASEELLHELKQGTVGIQRVTDALSCVEAETAVASVKNDEDRIKALIRSEVGFEKLNSTVRGFFASWVGHVVGHFMEDVVEERHSHKASTISSQNNTQRATIGIGDEQFAEALRSVCLGGISLGMQRYTWQDHWQGLVDEPMQDFANTDGSPRRVPGPIEDCAEDVTPEERILMVAPADAWGYSSSRIPEERDDCREAVTLEDKILTVLSEDAWEKVPEETPDMGI